MDQLSFAPGPSFPVTFEDVQSLYTAYIYEGEKDDDVFTSSEIKNGRSYSMYGKKVMEFIPKSSKGARIRVFPIEKDEKPYDLRADCGPDALMAAMESLKRMKKQIFRNTITEVFGCCNDFKKCSAVDACIHQDDRFYNGCIYRSNLEAGRNYYKDSPTINQHAVFSNIVGLDFETANPSRTSACAVAAVKYDLAGEEISRYYSLINPHEDFDGFNIMIHGITPDDVNDAPDIAGAMENVFRMIDGSSLVVCHNASFDMSVLRNSLSKNPLNIPDFYFTCTYRLASRVLPKNVSYTLPDVAEQCGIMEMQHHYALSDADICVKILLYMMGMFDNDIDKLHQTANLNFGHFQNGEYDGIHKAISESLTSGSSPSHHAKSTQIRKLPELTIGENSPFYGKTVVFTGKLESMTRKEAIEIINKIGGIGEDTFTKKTNILVTGYQNPSVLAGKEKSHKRIMAEQMLAQGHDIEIIPEDQFIRML